MNNYTKSTYLKNYMKSMLSVEVANLPPTQFTKLGAFLLALGLVELAGNGEGKKSAHQNAAIMRDLVNPRFFKNYAIPDNFFKFSSSDPSNMKMFAKPLKDSIRVMVEDPNISTDEVSLLKFSVLFLENPTKNANYVERAKKHAATISAAYYRNFQKVVERIHGSTSGNKNNIVDLQRELSELVADITGKKAKLDVLSVPNKIIVEMRRAGGENLDRARRYAQMRRDLGASYDKDLIGYISSKNPSVVKIQDAYEHMTKLGYKIHKIPNVPKNIPLKLGMVLGKPKFYTGDDRPIAQNIPSNAKDIKLSARYNPKTGEGGYLTYTSDVAAGITRVYTESHLNKSSAKISSDTQKVTSKINSVLARWKKDLTSPDPLKKMGATASVMIYMTAMRVGARQTSAASQSGEATYGAISLRPTHISLRKNSIFLKYKGKAASKTGLEQQHIIKVDPSDGLTKRVYQNLEKLMAGKKKTDLVFSVPNKNKNKKPIVLTYAAYIQYLKESGYPAGPHKMRRVRGTNLMLDLLKKEKFNLSVKASGNLSRSQKEGEQFIIEKILTPIAILLGHKSGTGATLWRTTVKSYVETPYLIKWFKDQGLRVPRWVPTTAKD